MFELTIRYNVLLDEIVDLCRGRSCASGSILGGLFVPPIASGLRGDYGLH